MFERAATRPISHLFSFIFEGPKPQTSWCLPHSRLLNERVVGSYASVLIIAYWNRRVRRRLKVRLGELRSGRRRRRMRGLGRRRFMRRFLATETVFSSRRFGLLFAGSRYECRTQFHCWREAHRFSPLPQPPLLASVSGTWRWNRTATNGSGSQQLVREGHPTAGRSDLRKLLCGGFIFTSDMKAVRFSVRSGYSRFGARRFNRRRDGGLLVKCLDTGRRRLTWERAKRTFTSLARPATNELSLSLSSLFNFYFKHNMYDGGEFRPIYFLFQDYITEIFGSGKGDGQRRDDDLRKLITIRFRWDPGGPLKLVQSRFYRLTGFLSLKGDKWFKPCWLLFLAPLGGFGFGELGLRGRSVNSDILHIWDTVSVALIWANVFALEACLWIELSGTNIVLHLGKSL